jgi:hypothetical protein
VTLTKPAGFYQHERNPIQERAHPMLSPIDEVTLNRGTLSRITAMLGIIALLLSGAFWLFSASATAQHAEQLSRENAQKLENKADKDDLREIKQDIKEIRDFLLNGKNVR